MIAAIRARKDELGMSDEVFEERAGLSKGRFGQVFGPGQARAIGITPMLAAAGAVGLDLLFRPNAEETARISARCERREEHRRHTAGTIRRPISDALVSTVARALGARGGTMQKRFRIPLWRRRQLARKAARARWG